MAGRPFTSNGSLGAEFDFVDEFFNCAGFLTEGKDLFPGLLFALVVFIGEGFGS